MRPTKGEVRNRGTRARMQCTLVYCVQCVVCSSRSILDNLQCTLHTVHCIVYRR